MATAIAHHGSQSTSRNLIAPLWHTLVFAGLSCHSAGFGPDTPTLKDIEQSDFRP
jgi:hypothetical protein